MKKIAIVTLSDFNNYGNRLQNYALERIITSQGYDVVSLVDFRPNLLKTSVKTIIKKDGIKFTDRMKKIRKLISGDVPSGLNIYILYLMNLAATVLSYWLFAYKNSLLQAHQRVDVVSKITLVTNTFQYAIQILILVLSHNYYYYVLAILATQGWSSL